MPPPTVREAFERGAARLRSARLHYGHGTSSARDEAAWLLAHALHVAPHALATQADRLLSARESRQLQHLLERRIRERIPAAYLTHEAWLGEHAFYVDRRVIVPRSHIAELLEQRMAPWLARAPRRVLDLCCGSGCLAIVAAHAFPRARVDAADISAGARAVAARNVAAHRLKSRVRLVRSDLFGRLGGRRYGLIVSNPPYVDVPAMRALPAEYRHEPRLALAGGRDGLDLVRRILAEAAQHLTPRGVLVCEVGSARRVLEKSFPSLPFLWLATAGAADSVFLLERAALAASRGSLSLPSR